MHGTAGNTKKGKWREAKDYNKGFSGFTYPGAPRDIQCPYWEL